MRKILLFICLLWTHTIKAQGHRYMDEKGTSLSIIPPKGFMPATKFSGFESQDKYSYLKVYEF